MIKAAANPTLIPLEGIDPAQVEALLERAFGPDRHARTAYRVRAGTRYLPALSFAAIDGQEGAEELVGSIQAWPVALTDPAGRRHPLVMVGPMAVAPERQNEGFGHALLAALTGALAPEAPLPLVLIGDPEYYGRFGFVADHTGGWDLPGPFERRRLLVRAANPAILPERGLLGPWLS